MALMGLMMVVEKVRSSCKIINAKKNNEDKIEAWGDGKQTRSFYMLMTA